MARHLALLIAAFLASVPAVQAEEPIQAARDTAAVEAERCAAAVDDDEVRPYMPALRRVFSDAFAENGEAPDLGALRTGVWRCMDHHLVGCLIGANQPCARMNTMRRNPGADGFCRDNPDSAFVPLAAAGHDSIYDWRCAGRQAVIGRTAYQLDPRGFAVGLWRRLD